MDSSFFDMNKFSTDKIRAVDAKFEAQKIAFAPLCFQAIRGMIELGILKAIEDAGDDGISCKALSEKTSISEYGVGVLCEMALGMNVIKLVPNCSEEKFVIGKNEVLARIFYYKPRSFSNRSPFFLETIPSLIL